MPAMRIAAWLVAASAAVFVQSVSVTPAVAGPLDTPPVNDTVRDPAMHVPTSGDPVSPLDPIRVRVYRSTHIHRDSLSLALRVAETTFAAAGIQVVLTVCEPKACLTPPAPTEQLVRLVRLPHGQRRDVRCLGDALIDPLQQRGGLATVYVDHVLDVARRLRIDPGRLLGHSIAHEVGHLSLRTTTHAPSGLMSEVWSRKALQAGPGDDWALLPFEAEAIKLRLTPSRSTS